MEMHLRSQIRSFLKSYINHFDLSVVYCCLHSNKRNFNHTAEKNRNRNSDVFEVRVFHLLRRQSDRFKYSAESTTESVEATSHH